MDTPLTARHLKEIATDLEWTQQDIQVKTGIDRTVVSNHLSGKRPIRDEHLADYIRVVPGIDKLRLLTAWIRDVMHEDDLSTLLNADEARLAQEASTWLPPLTDEQRDSLQWLAGEMIKDRDLDDWTRTTIRRLGYKPQP